MPASRKARAMTLAPRSWPSRPGFATKTRILASSDTSQFKHRVSRGAQGTVVSREAKLRRQLNGFDIETAPKIPAGNAAIRLPAFGDLFHLRGLGQFPLVVVLSNGSLHAIVAGRQNIGPAQRKHEEHMRRPDADAFDLREMGNHIVV